MKLSEVEVQRSGLVQFLVVLIMIFLACIMLLAYRQQSGIAIPILAILSLLACLYAVVKERGLRRFHDRLVEDLVAKERQVDELGQDLEQEHSSLIEEKGRAERLDVRLHEVADLYRAISSVNAVQDLGGVPEAVLKAALNLVDGNCGSIMLLDESRKHLVIACSEGLRPEVVQETRRPVGDGIAGWVAERREPLLLSGSAAEDGRFQNRVLDRDLRISLSVPLEVRGTVIGVLNLGSRDDEAHVKFTEWHLRMAAIYGQHASVALRNAQLTHTLRSHGLLPESGN